MATTTLTPEIVLEVTGLGVDFWVDGTFYPAAIDLNYSVRRGEVLAIVGESGSGKSSSSMALLGLLPANAKVTGSIKLLGRELQGIPDRELRQVRGNQVAVIFQEPMTALNPVYTIGFQIMEALRSHFDLTPTEARERAIDLLTKVEMPDPLIAFNKYPHQLSGGQRQRAMIAQSISCDPVLLIADEPTTALDVTVQAEILDLLRSLHKRLDSAIILITHDMGVVADLADHIMVMKDGLAVETGTVIDVFTRPTAEYTKSLLAAVPHLGAATLETAERVAPVRTDTREAVLRFENVAIDYPKRGRVPAFRAAEYINLEIFPGEIVGLVGES
uniref:ATP-binding cassette domain-containing protein n=1 Tax=Salinibacterium sp. TaxID=1915057 RepID=UPI00286C6548